MKDDAPTLNPDLAALLSAFAAGEASLGVLV